MAPCDRHDETLAEMLMAGFDEAHTEGLLDAAAICGDVADGSPPSSRVARVLENALRSLVELNAMQFPAPGANRLQLGEH